MLQLKIRVSRSELQQGLNVNRLAGFWNRQVLPYSVSFDLTQLILNLMLVEQCLFRYFNPTAEKTTQIFSVV